MSIFDFFRKKKEVEKPEKKVEPVVKAPVKKKIFLETNKILSAPYISEKASQLADNNQYVFKVWPRANKIEIKKAIESLYKVDVEKVNIINIPRKSRRYMRRSGYKTGYKKAIITVKKGQKIEVLPR